MTNFLQYLISGVAQGAIYALVALGFVIIFRGTRVLNFAQGVFMLFGAFVVFNIVRTWGLEKILPRWGLYFWAALLISVLVMTLAGIGVESLVLRPLRNRPTFTVIMATLGLSIAGEQIAISVWGTDPLPLNDPFGIKTFNIGGVNITLVDIVTLIAAAVIAGALLLFFNRSALGTAMRATSFDPEAAIAQGINPRVVYALSWGIASGIASVAGVMLSSGNGRNVSPTLIPFALTAVPAAILGGLDSTKGALVGGIVIGLSQRLMEGYQGNISTWLGSHVHLTIGTFTYKAGLGLNFHLVFPYLIMVLILLVRPYGLFGTKEVRRV
jgi:branched-chain amino acid transport system permease protein